jgi:hypothetical protein
MTFAIEGRVSSDIVLSKLANTSCGGSELKIATSKDLIFFTINAETS